MKENKRLPCDNIDDFINGVRNYYSIDTSYEFRKGDIITLYNHDTECNFIIKVAFYIGGLKRLGIVKYD